MLVLLPPSEGKAAGGTGRPLDLDRLSSPSLTSVRARLVDALQDLARRDLPGLATVLKCSPEQALLDADLTTSRTLPALARYTGVVYDNLGYASLTGGALRRANSSLLVCSALFGLLRPRDPVPAYRLSGGTVLPGVGGLAALWRPAVEPLLEQERLVVDLRSGAYASLARVPHAVVVRVLRDDDGVRSTVSHDNKWTKGRLARLLCEHGARSTNDVAELGRTLADSVEVTGKQVDLVLTGLASARQQP